MYANQMVQNNRPQLGAWYNELLTAGTSLVTQYQTLTAQQQQAKAAAEYQKALAAQAQAQAQIRAQQPTGIMGSQNMIYYALAGVAVLAVVFMMTKK